MEGNVFRPRHIGFILAVSIVVFFIMLVSSLSIIVMTKINELYAFIAFPLTFTIMMIWLNTTQHMIIVGENFISVPRVHSRFSDEDTPPSLSKYDKELLKVSFDDVKSFKTEYGYINGKAFFYIIFDLNDGTVKKIDAKRFGEKQIVLIISLLRKKIKTE